MIIGSFFTIAGGLCLYAAALTQGSGKIGLFWPFMFHLLNSVGFAHILPVSLALFSKIAPRQINATVIGLYYLAFFSANKIVGQIGQLYSTMPTHRHSGCSMSPAPSSAWPPSSRSRCSCRTEWPIGGRGSGRSVKPARRASRRPCRREPFQLLTRLGFAGRGLLYIVIGLLVILTGRTEDLTGALEYFGGGLGKFLLAVLAAGMAVYGLWRLSDAAFGIENFGHDTKAIRKRTAAGGIGAIYLYLAYKAVRILLGGHASPSNTQQQADTVLDLPGGAAVLALAALLLAAAGAMQLYKAGTASFMRRLNVTSHETLVEWLGRIGYAARGVIFLAVAYRIACAAADEQSTEAGGMEQALDLLSGPLLYAVAAGLMLFGLFSVMGGALPPHPRRARRHQTGSRRKNRAIIALIPA